MADRPDFGETDDFRRLFRRATDAQLREMRRVSNGLREAGEVVRRGGEALDAARTAVLSAAESAEAAGFEVEDDGTVPVPTQDDGSVAARQSLARAAAWHQRRIVGALEEAGRTDERVTAELRDAWDAPVPGVDHDPVEIPWLIRDAARYGINLVHSFEYMAQSMKNSEVGKLMSKYAADARLAVALAEFDERRA